MSYLPDINNAKVAGTATSVNSGTKDNGTQRIVLATDQPALTNKLLVTPDLPSGASTDASITETHGTKAAGTAATKSDLTGAVYNTAAPAPTNGQQVANQADSAGNIRINPSGQIGSFTSSDTTAGAGLEVTLTVPASTKWVLKACNYKIVASAGVANRSAQITAKDAAGKIMASAADPQLTTAGQTHRTTFGPGLVNAAFANNNDGVSFPELCLGPGATLVTTTTNMQVGDVVELTACVIQFSD
jgi:hypothetical protein